MRIGLGDGRGWGGCITKYNKNTNNHSTTCIIKKIVAQPRGLVAQKRLRAEVARAVARSRCARVVRGGCARSLSVLSCSVLSCLVLSCPVCPVSSCPVPSCPVLSCPVLSCPIPSHPVLSYPVPSCPVLSSPVPSVPNEFDGSASSCAVGCARGCTLVVRELRALRVHPSPSDRRSRHTAFTQRQACQRDSSDRQALQTDWHSR